MNTMHPLPGRRELLMMLGTGLLSACHLTVIQQPTVAKRIPHAGPLKFPASIHDFGRRRYQQHDGPVPTGHASYSMGLVREGHLGTYLSYLTVTVDLLSAEGSSPEQTLEALEHQTERLYPEAYRETNLGRQTSGSCYIIEFPTRVERHVCIELHASRHGSQLIAYAFQYPGSKRQEFRYEIDRFMKAFEAR